MATVVANNTNMTFLDIIRVEGAKMFPKQGFNYIMAREGTFEDFKNGNIPFIRLKTRGGGHGSYAELRSMGKTDDDIHKLFVRFFTREYVLGSGAADPYPELVQEEWLSFKTNKTTQKIKLPVLPGGKVTYATLIADGKSDYEIAEIFKMSRRVTNDMQPGSYRYKMAEEYKKMRNKFTIDEYNKNARTISLSANLNKWSKGSAPIVATSFCAAVARMMTLVRLSHQQKMANTAQTKILQWQKQKKIANDKKTTKYNTLKNTLGLSAFNAKKRRDQAASEVRKATAINDKPRQISEFLSWRASLEGRKYDTAPQGDRVNVLFAPFASRGVSKKHLGHASRYTLEALVKKYVLNTKASGFKISFDIDTCDAKTQLFQHVAMNGGVSPLSKTRDVNSSQVFTITGYIRKSRIGHDAFYVNLDNMKASVYCGLPTKWKMFEAWEGYDIKGNPKLSTSMRILFKITPYNIKKFSFIWQETQYTVEYTSVYSMQKSLTVLESKMQDKITMASTAAALFAKKAKERRAEEARAKARAWRGHRNKPPSFPMSSSTNKSVKAMLAQQLAEGKIDMEAFKLGMSALD